MGGRFLPAQALSAALGTTPGAADEIGDKVRGGETPVAKFPG